MLLALSLFLVGVSCVDRVAPWIHITPSVFSPEVCRALIEAAEEIGFAQNYDSIDAFEPINQSSQDIYVYDQGQVKQHKIYALLKGRLAELALKIKKLKDESWAGRRDGLNKMPNADWIFLRKYSPTSRRNMLKVHHDHNEYTMNVPLNDQADFKGGGFVVVKPPRQKEGFDFLEVPHVDDKYRGYDWLGTVKRENTSEVMFPQMTVGSTIIYNYTVHHGIAPLEEGTRYSLVFFYEMNNIYMTPKPMEGRPVAFRTDYQGEDVLDLYWIDRGGKLVLQYEDLKQGKRYVVTTYQGEQFVGKLRGSQQQLGPYTVNLASHEIIVTRGVHGHDEL